MTAAGAAADRRNRPRADARSSAALLIDRWLLDDSPPLVLVADLGHRVLGFVTVEPGDVHPLLDLPPTLVITDAVVDAAHRRRGIGRASITAVRQHADRERSTVIEVGTLALDDRAVRFWRSLAFGDWPVTLGLQHV